MRKLSRRKASSRLDSRSKLPVSSPQKMESCISEPFSSLTFYGKKIPENTKPIIKISRINSASIPSDINISLSTTQSINRPKSNARKRRRKLSFASNNAGHKVKKNKKVCHSYQRKGQPIRKATKISKKIGKATRNISYIADDEADSIDSSSISSGDEMEGEESSCSSNISDDMDKPERSDSSFTSVSTDSENLQDKTENICSSSLGGDEVMEKVKKKLVRKSTSKCLEERGSRPTRKAFAQAVKSITSIENGTSTDDSSTCERRDRVRKTAEMKERESIEKELRAQSRREKRIMAHNHKREKQIRRERRLKEQGIEKRTVPKREAAAHVAKKIAMAYCSSSSDDENYNKKAKEVKLEEATPPTPKFSEYEKAALSKIALRLQFLKSLNIAN